MRSGVAGKSRKTKPGSEPRRPNLVANVVKQIETLSLAATEGDLLGDENTLLTRLGISRPTLRQAAKVAESEFLLSIRRGLRGGYYAARPKAEDAIRPAARYLRLEGATLADLYRVVRRLDPEMAALAAACTDTGLIGELASLRADLLNFDGDFDDTKVVVRSEEQIASVIARMTSNPLLVLFNEVFFAFGFLEREHQFFNLGADRRESHDLQLELCEAILSHKEDEARLVSLKRLALLARRLGISAAG